MSTHNATRGYSPEGAAEALGVVTAESIRIGLRTGAIKGTKIGTRWLISQATIDRILSEGMPTLSRPRGSTAKPQKSAQRRAR